MADSKMSNDRYATARVIAASIALRRRMRIEAIQIVANRKPLIANAPVQPVPDLSEGALVSLFPPENEQRAVRVVADKVELQVGTFSPTIPLTVNLYPTIPVTLSPVIDVAPANVSVAGTVVNVPLDVLTSSLASVGEQIGLGIASLQASATTQGEAAREAGSNLASQVATALAGAVAELAKRPAPVVRVPPRPPVGFRIETGIDGTRRIIPETE